VAAGHRGAGHAHDLTDNTRLLGWALALTVLTMLVEGAGGFLSGSLALLADAGHMLTDVAALGLSLFAFWLSARPRTTRHTFGWRRFEIFAAFLNGVALWGIAVVIAYEAYQRFKAPPRVRTGLMLIVALLGLASNVGVAAILSRGRKRNLNLRGAFLHVLADGLGSIGVLAAAVIIRLTGAPIWDPIVSAGVCLLILWSSGRVIKESFHILMEAAPRNVDIEAVGADRPAGGRGSPRPSCLDDHLGVCFLERPPEDRGGPRPPGGFASGAGGHDLELRDRPHDLPA
jgi:cobalt-zinc-cadmium efflux system protein